MKYMENKATETKLIKWLCLAILSSFLILGICLRLSGGSYNGWEYLFLYIGISGIVGLGTNWLAVRMILDYVEIPLIFTRIRMPGSGLLQRNLNQVIEFVSSGSMEILNPDTIKKEIREQNIVNSISNAIKESAEETAIVGRIMEIALSSAASLVEKDEFYFIIRDKVVKSYAEKHLSAKLANLTGIIDYDDMTYKILDAIKERIEDVKTNSDSILEAKSALQKTLRDININEEAAEEQILALIDIVIRKFDIGAVVKNRLAEFTPRQIKEKIQEGASEYLGWIELWGGILGAIVGLIMWAVI